MKVFLFRLKCIPKNYTVHLETYSDKLRTLCHKNVFHILQLLHTQRVLQSVQRTEEQLLVPGPECH